MRGAAVNKLEDHFGRWKNREEIAEAMIPMIGRLYREKNVTTTVYSRSLVNNSVIQILKTHRFVKQIEDSELFESGLSVVDSFPILQEVTKLDLGPCRLDIGKLAVEYKKDSRGLSVEDYVREELGEAVNDKVDLPGQTDVVLYGFGRIGRLLARLLIEKTGSGDGLRLKAVVVRETGKGDLQKRASLLRRDSVHGPFAGTIAVDEEDNAIIANGNYIKIIYANDPSAIDYTQYGIQDALLVDNTGKWRDREGLGQHLKCPGISKAILTAPGKGDIKNIVPGVNHGMVEDSDTILSLASCTTNAIVPPLKALSDKFGIEYGHVETVHSYTNDQNLLDNFHKGPRRGRAAPLNMVLTETGAATAAAKALPELGGKLSGNSIRVPTPDVSMAILNLTLEQETTLEELNDYLRWVSLHSPLQRQLDFIRSPDAVSTDFVGSRHASVVDAEATIVNGRHCVLYVWYDNEFGYSCQVVRLLQQLSGVEYPIYPKD
ncbi:MAG TPA: glyceraldehyde-3-phosphate dehydrogenase [Alcanivorax sp.]|jgi:glyceraldehyde 3-phosphate dehydrogenase|nr:glyceraldehyde-3-phosphate dehydrogenase [Alcanivorax sp.]MBL4723072.1 glyceraldehyde-3-phosphate dehydrogenase [Alcanivorax sp.]MTI51678.1 glyceraldehyde-3-phosphate dehydrogenase [Alcanivorax sp.]HAB09097.1 glyceraldehyde-3-phosphate dehydrogenase [Alcanivorax sp.]HAI24706.1 glyceraldehyde-3-phosphate dehydrogenase [Alcanivorax sp.]|tara:strand:- start:74 stop:1543 length:1470 start_codon:yes stop_codon:yes gene_type:complete